MLKDNEQKVVQRNVFTIAQKSAKEIYDAFRRRRDLLMTKQFYQQAKKTQEQMYKLLVSPEKFVSVSANIPDKKEYEEMLKSNHIEFVKNEEPSLNDLLSGNADTLYFIQTTDSKKMRLLTEYYNSEKLLGRDGSEAFRVFSPVRNNDKSAEKALEKTLEALSKKVAVNTAILQGNGFQATDQRTFEKIGWSSER